MLSPWPADDNVLVPQRAVWRSNYGSWPNPQFLFLVVFPSAVQHILSGWKRAAIRWTKYKGHLYPLVLQQSISVEIQYWPKVTHAAHFLRSRSARHLQYTNGRHTRHMCDTRVSHAAGAAFRAHPTHMLYKWCALHIMRDIRVANAMQNSPEARITRVAPGVRSALLSMGYFWSVLYPYICIYIFHISWSFNIFSRNKKDIILFLLFSWNLQSRVWEMCLHFYKFTYFPRMWGVSDTLPQRHYSVLLYNIKHYVDDVRLSYVSIYNVFLPWQMK
jgi:hypothetical protein